jgi:hypothetical protein
MATGQIERLWTRTQDLTTEPEPYNGEDPPLPQTRWVLETCELVASASSWIWNGVVVSCGSTRGRTTVHGGVRTAEGRSYWGKSTRVVGIACGAVRETT